MSNKSGEYNWDQKDEFEFQEDDSHVLDYNWESDKVDTNFDALDNINNTTVHIRIFKRNANKSVTTIENLSLENLKSLVKKFKKNFNCNGCIINNVIQLQGDQRLRVKEYLISNKLVDKNSVSVHGF